MWCDDPRHLLEYVDADVASRTPSPSHHSLRHGCCPRSRVGRHRAIPRGARPSDQPRHGRPVATRHRCGPVRCAGGAAGPRVHCHRVTQPLWTTSARHPSCHSCILGRCDRGSHPDRRCLGSSRSGSRGHDAPCDRATILATNVTFLIGQFHIVAGRPVLGNSLQALLAPVVSTALLFVSGSKISGLAAAIGYSAGCCIVAVGALIHRRLVEEASGPSSTITARLVARESMPYLHAGLLLQTVDQLPILLCAPLLTSDQLGYAGLMLRLLGAFGLLSGGLTTSRTAQLRASTRRQRDRIVRRIRAEFIALAAPAGIVFVIVAPRLFAPLGGKPGLVNRQALSVAVLLNILAAVAGPAVQLLTLDGARHQVRLAYFWGAVALGVSAVPLTIVLEGDGSVLAASTASLVANLVAASLVRRRSRNPDTQLLGEDQKGKPPDGSSRDIRSHAMPDSPG